jgi:hypothetical protein
MKFADSWVDEEPSVSVVSSDFHDEVEEYDEVDESKDGCGGVAWQPYVLRKAHTSNKLLHELAREIRGVEKRLGKRLTIAHYRSIFTRWETASKPFLRSDHDYFTDLLAKLDCVTVPKGETLRAALERAKVHPPPKNVLAIPNEDVRLFASLCCELQLMAGDRPIMLHQGSIGSWFGVSYRTIGNWIMALKTAGILKIAEPAISKKRAARYFCLD